MKTVFVAGTDTGVGKTVVAGAITAALRLKGHRVAVMKPVACGSWDDTRFLLRCAASKNTLSLTTPVYLKEPLSPNVAAMRQKKRLDFRGILKARNTLARMKPDYLIVEGCGGLLVPFNDERSMADLIGLMKASVILVSRSGLGAINHSLLCLEALRKRRFKTLGVVFNRLSGGPMSIPEKTNPDVVARWGHTVSLGIFPYMKIDCPVDCLAHAALKHLALEKTVC